MSFQGKIPRDSPPRIICLVGYTCGMSRLSVGLKKYGGIPSPPSAYAITGCTILVNISTSGTFMQSVAQAWLVLKITNSGTALGLVSALQYVPILLFGAYGGVIADRFPKRTILFITQSLSGILALILGVLVATNLVQIWMVYILAFCLGMVNAFDNPTRQSFVIEMVGEDKIRNAVTLWSGLVNLSRVIGPAIAAGLIALVGLAPCFIINGLSYGAVIIMLARMNPRELNVALPSPRSPGQAREGIRYVLSKPILRNILLMLALVGTLTFEFQVSLLFWHNTAFTGMPAVMHFYPEPWVWAR